MSDITYHVHLRDDTTAIFLIGEMYQASLLQATTMSNVHVQGLSRFVQRTTLYNADPANIINDILQPRPDNIRPILAPNPTATILTVYKLHLDEYTSVANDIRTIAQHIMSGLSPSATTHSMRTQLRILISCGNPGSYGTIYSAYMETIQSTKYNSFGTNSTHQLRTQIPWRRTRFCFIRISRSLTAFINPSRQSIK